MLAAAGALFATGTASVATGVGVLQGAIGAAITMATAAMATPFASGGIVTGPTVGLMGEAGSAEAAIPLNDRGAKFMQSAMGGGRRGTRHHLSPGGQPDDGQSGRSEDAQRDPYEAGVHMSKGEPPSRDALRYGMLDV